MTVMIAPERSREIQISDIIKIILISNRCKEIFKQHITIITVKSTVTANGNITYAVNRKKLKSRKQIVANHILKNTLKDI